MNPYNNGSLKQEIINQAIDDRLTRQKRIESLTRFVALLCAIAACTCLLAFGGGELLHKLSRNTGFSDDFIRAISICLFGVPLYFWVIRMKEIMQGRSRYYEIFPTATAVAICTVLAGALWGHPFVAVIGVN